MMSKGKLSFTDLQFDKKWEYHSADGKASYISGIIPGTSPLLETIGECC